MSKHWLSVLLEKHGAQEGELTYSLETAILDTIKSKLPEEMPEVREVVYEPKKIRYDKPDERAKGFNECLKAVKEALELK